MSIYRCNGCGFVSEESTTPVGQKISCSRCGTPSTVYGTVFFVEKLVERYAAAMRELQALRAADDAPESNPGNDTAGNEPAGAAALMDAADYNTRNFATAEQHAPLQAWFASRLI